MALLGYFRRNLLYPVIFYNLIYPVLQQLTLEMRHLQRIKVVYLKGFVTPNVLQGVNIL